MDERDPLYVIDDNYTFDGDHFVVYTDVVAHL